jgi:hypothetical protein
MKRFITPLVMLTAGAILGVLSAQYMMETRNVALETQTGGWTEIRADLGDLQSMYAAAHFLRAGAVPPPKGSRYFVRSEDDDGNSLRGDCLVTIEGTMPATRWWLINAKSGTRRATLDASQAVREANGDTVLSISASPAPGNWLIPPRNGGYELQLVLHGLSDAPATSLKLPRVKRLWC